MNILLLTDFSNHACEAHKYAINLLSDKQVSYFLVNTMPVASTVNTIHDKNISPTNQLNQMYDELVNFLSPNQTLSRVETEGNLLDVVRKQISLLDVDMVVMGAKGSDDIPHKSIGKNTYEIATKVKCPVLIVPENTPMLPPKKVIFPVDYNDRLHDQCISKIHSLPHWEKMKLVVHELNSVPNSAYQLQSSEVLNDHLKTIHTEYKQVNHLDYQVISHESDLMLLAAKNLGVCSSIFKQLNHEDNTTLKPIPMLILHA